MSKRHPALLAGVSMLVGLSVFSRADTPRTNLAKKVADFQLNDTTGKLVSLSDFKDKKAIAVIFIGTECPINNAVMPILAGLDKEYGPRGVQFLGINANAHDTAVAVALHARKYEIPFPVLKDRGSSVADLFGARRSPEAFLLDGQGVIRYQGRIDDQFGIGYKRGKPTRRDLAEAIEEVLAGKPVSQPTTPVAGCVIARAPQVKARGMVTFSKHVAPILQTHCQECHRPGQIGPMSLLTYENATAWSDTIREVIQQERMPPWGADPRYGTFANDRRLSADERDTLLGWLDHGMPRGDDKDLPPPRTFPQGWIIGEPDVVLSMPREFEVPAEMPKYGIPYKYFFVDPGFKEDRWVVRAEAKAGAVEVVHHFVVFIVPPGKRLIPGDPRTPALAGTAPGDMPLILPEGVAKKVPAGSRLAFQMHYTPNGKAQKDRSSLGLIFAKEPPRHQVVTEPVYELGIDIPAGADNYQAESWFEFRADAHIIGFMPHMHLRGKDFRYEAVYPDGKTEVLLSVPHFNFNWQSVYRLARPLAVPKGTQIDCTAHYDNSAGNPNNPDPTQGVRWGDQTWEEMMIGWMDFFYDRKAE